jgi:hypothetical protein
MNSPMKWIVRTTVPAAALAGVVPTATADEVQSVAAQAIAQAASQPPIPAPRVMPQEMSISGLRR